MRVGLTLMFSSDFRYVCFLLFKTYYYFNFYYLKFCKLAFPLTLYGFPDNKKMSFKQKMYNGGNHTIMSTKSRGTQSRASHIDHILTSMREFVHHYKQPAFSMVVSDLVYVSYSYEKEISKLLLVLTYTYT